MNTCIEIHHVRLRLSATQGMLNGRYVWSETTLNYQMMVERYPNLKEEVGSSNLGCEISSLPGGKLVRWSTASCALTLAHRPSVSKSKVKMADVVDFAKAIYIYLPSSALEVRVRCWHTHADHGWCGFGGSIWSKWLGSNVADNTIISRLRIWQFLFPFLVHVQQSQVNVNLQIRNCNWGSHTRARGPIVDTFQPVSGRDPSASKSNWLHVDIFQFFLY